MTPDELKSILDRLRDDRGITRAEVCRLLNISPKTLYFYENGDTPRTTYRKDPSRVPKAVELAMFALMMGVTEYHGEAPGLMLAKGHMPGIR